jgi:hypothetical protein
MTDGTTIRVSDEVADELHARKQRGESYDDVLRRLLWGDAEAAESPPEEAAAEEAPDPDPGAEAEAAKVAGPSPAAEPGSAEWVGYYLERMDEDLPSGVEFVEATKAVAAAREHIDAEGEATMREIVRAVMPEHPLGYNVEDALETIDAGDRFRGAWWRRVVKPGLEALPDVRKPPTGRSDWSMTID